MARKMGEFKQILVPASHLSLVMFALEVENIFFNGRSEKTIVLVRVYNQQFQGTILFMDFDFQGSCARR